MSPRAHAILAVGLALAGAVATLWRPTAPSFAGVATDLDRFGADVLAVVHAYVRPRRVGALVSLSLTVLVPLVAVVTPWGRRSVARLAGTGDRRWPARGALVAFAIAFATDLARLPVTFWFGYVQDGRFGFRTAGPVGWFRDWLLASGTGWLLTAVGAAGFVWVLANWRAWRWILVWAATAATAVVVLLGPLLFEPLWLPTRPLSDGPVRQAVSPVLERAGMGDVPILVGDASRRTTKANAYVSGLGPSRRLVLFDNLLELEPDRVAWVVGHEVAHREHRDVPRGVLLTATGMLPAVFVLGAVLRSGRVSTWFSPRGPADPRLVAVVVAFAAVATVVALPVANLASRRAEAAADHRALELTRDPTAAVEVQRTFVVRDLADPRPPAWSRTLWGTHPPPAVRIRAAVGHAGRHDLPVPSLAEVRDRLAEVRHPRIVEG